MDGNHENFDLLYKLPVVSWMGGKNHEIPGTDVLHLMRGQMFHIDGCDIFTFGGARSHDITDGIIPYDGTDSWKRQAKRLRRLDKYRFRVDHISWWQEEMPSEAEMAEGLETLARHGWRCDYIITHECSTSTMAMLYGSAGEQNELTRYLEEIHQKTSYRRWYFGHHHHDEAVNDKEIMLYEKIIRIW